MHYLPLCLSLIHTHPDTGASTITICHIKSECEAACRGLTYGKSDGNSVGNVREFPNTSDVHMHALSLYFSCVTPAFQPPIPQRYLNTFGAQLFTLLPALSLSLFPSPFSYTHTHVQLCLYAFMLEEPLICRVPWEPVCRSYISTVFISWGCSQLRKRLISLENRDVLCTHFTC